MSRVYWHSLSEHEAELRGSERAYCDALVSRFGMAMLGIYGWTDRHAAIWTVVAPDSWPAKMLREGKVAEAAASLETHFRGTFSDGPFVDIGGRSVSIPYAVMNTAIQAGSMQMGLAARIHGNCENHLWVDGPNRAWLADIMERGRAIGIYREEMGWESVIELLRKRDDEPVVTSFSVTDQFPNLTVAREAGDAPKPTPEQWEEHGEDARWMAFSELPEAEQWDRCMKALRARGAHYELRPDNWYEVHYDHQGGSEKVYTAFDVLEEASRRDHEQHPERYAGYKPTAKAGVDSPAEA